MHPLVYLLLVGASAVLTPAGIAFAAGDAAKATKPGKITIKGSKDLATIDEATGEVEYLKGVEPTEVVKVLIQSVYAAQKRIAELEAPKPVVTKKK